VTQEQFLDFVSDFGWIIGIIFSSILLGRILFWLAKKTLKNRYPDLASQLRKVKQPFYIIIILLGFQVMTIFLPQVNNPVVNHLLQILYIVAISWLFINMVNGLKAYLLKQYEYQDVDNLKARKIYTQVRVFERIIIVLIFILAIALILMTFESIRRIGTSILASAGIAGIIIGLAAQKLIANLLAGFQLAITQPIRLDDVVIVENEWGRIKEITLTYVVIAIWDKRNLVVPSTYFIEKPFQNWTRQNSEIFGTVVFYLDYSVPVEKLRAALDEILDSTDLWDGTVSNIQVTDSTEKSMQVRVLVSAKDSGSAWDLRVLIREKMIEYINREFPGSFPKLRIEMEK